MYGITMDVLIHQWEVIKDDDKAGIIYFFHQQKMFISVNYIFTIEIGVIFLRSIQ